MFAVLLAASVHLVAALGADFQCEASCVVHCDESMNCNDLNIMAQKSSNLTVWCSSDKYCSNMRVYSPIGGPNSIPQAQINCLADDHASVCTGLQILGKQSVIFLQCAAANGTACSQALIRLDAEQEWGILNRLGIDVGLQTTVQNIQVEAAPWSTLYITNSGVMNKLVVESKGGSSLLLLGKPGLISQATIAATKTFIKSMTVLDSHLDAHRLELAVDGDRRFERNTVSIQESEDQVLNMDSSIQNRGHFANNSFLVNGTLSVTTMSPSAIMSGNRFVANGQGGSVGPYQVSMSVEDSHFVGNSLNMSFLTEFNLICAGVNSTCSSHGDRYTFFHIAHLSVSSTAGSPSVPSFNGVVFDVEAVVRADFISTTGGTFRDVVINTPHTNQVNVEMGGEGSPSSVVVNASQAGFLNVNCSDRSLSSEYSPCSGLELIVPVQAALLHEVAANLLCEGMGCEELTLVTTNGAQDVKIHVTHCDCSEPAFQAMIADGNRTTCIEEWQILCEDSNASSTLDDRLQCDGQCCGNIAEQLALPNTDCSTLATVLEDWQIALIVVGSVAVVVVALSVALFFCWRQRARQNLRLVNQHDQKKVKLISS